MNKDLEFIRESIPSQEKANELMEKLFVVASPEAIFSKPLESGEYKVITASEVSVGMGFGYGGGGGFGDEPSEESEEPGGRGGGIGSGGGGGGGSMGRPVAAIEIGPNGVRVEPIVDPTKIAIAFFTTLVSMAAMAGRMRRGRL